MSCDVEDVKKKIQQAMMIAFLLRPATTTSAFSVSQLDPLFFSALSLPACSVSRYGLISSHLSLLQTFFPAKTETREKARRE